MQTVLLFAALFLSNPLVDVGEMNIAARFLLAFVPLRANLVKLFVVIAIALEAANVVEPSLVVDTSCQGLDTQVKGHDAVIAQGARLAFLSPFVCLAPIVLLLLRIVIDKRAVIIPARISRHGYFVKVLWRFFCQVRYDVLVAFRPPVATTACREDDHLVLHSQIHGRITERKELMTWLETGESRFLSSFHATEESLHGPIQTVVDLCQEFAVDKAQFRVILLALSQGLLGVVHVPAFPVAQLHDPPVV